MADRNVRVIDCCGKKPHIENLPKTATTAFDKNSLVEYASGVINPSDDNDINVKGVILEEVVSSDSDYSTAGARKLVQVLDGGEEVEMNYTGGAVVPGVSYGIVNAYTVDVADTGNKVVTAVRSISGTTSGRAVFTFKTYSGGLVI